MGVEVYPNGSQTIVVPASQSIAVQAIGDNAATVYQDVGYPNIPAAWRLIGTVLNTETVFGPFTPATNIRIDAGANPIYYEVGASPVVGEPIGNQTAGVTPWSTLGLGAAQGGSVGFTGGTSSTAANAGGAVINAGGTPGVTGVGGAVSNTGGAGGATSGVGGAATNRGGAGSAGNSAGGVASNIGGAGQGSAAGGAANTTGGVGGATGVGGNAALVGGAGGASSGSGGDALVTGGAGTAGNGPGGSTITTPGAANGSGVAGGNFLRSAGGLHFRQQTAATAKADGNQSVTAAQLINGICVFTITTGRTLTTPTGAAILAACPADIVAGDSFYFSIITVGTGADDIATITAGDGDVTFSGKVTVGPDTAAIAAYGTWLFLYTGTTAFVGYRIA